MFSPEIALSWERVKNVSSVLFGVPCTKAHNFNMYLLWIISHVLITKYADRLAESAWKHTNMQNDLCVSLCRFLELQKIHLYCIQNITKVKKKREGEREKIKK